MPGYLKRLSILMLFGLISVNSAYSQGVLVDMESSTTGNELFEEAVRRLAFRPDGSNLIRTLGEITESGGITSSQQLDQVNGLIARAMQADGEAARKLLWQAANIAAGNTWTTESEYLSGLQLRTTVPAMDSSNPGDLILDRKFALPVIDEPINYRIDLYDIRASESRTPVKGDFVANMAQGSLEGDFPQTISIAPTSVPDAAYIFDAMITAGDSSDVLAAQVYLISDITARHDEMKSTLSTFEGHEEAKALAEYPYALADAMQKGEREVVTYDFAKAFMRSGELVAALEQGKDPVRRAKGLQDRAYRFPQTGELIPYQLYVPKSWNGEEALPLVVVLHGANLDETDMLGRAEGKMQWMAEAYDFIVVAPLGYKLNSGYGATRSITTNEANNEFDFLDETVRAYSEQDVIQVMDLVLAEYPVDQSRMYLTGNSMGGAGTWSIAAKYPERWAAIAPSAAGGIGPEAIEAIKNIPVKVVLGELDSLVRRGVYAAVDVLKDGGMTPEFVVVPGGDHGSAFENQIPAIFEFFSTHNK